MEGTGIMLSNYLIPHIHKILKHEGGAISIDLYFKHDFKFRIISVYLSSTDISRRNSTQTKVSEWIQQALNQQLHPIVLGDFNIDISKPNSPPSRSRLINFLTSNNLYDLADHTSNTSYTWHNNQSTSRIDYIWSYESIIPYLQKFNLENPSTSTGSDHMILTSTWLFPHANSPNHKQKFKASRRIFDYSSMNKDTWEDFTNQVNYNLTQNRTPTEPDTDNSLETHWHKIQISITTAALKIIPNKKLKFKNFHHTYSSKATQLHQNLKLTGQII